MTLCALGFTERTGSKANFYRQQWPFKIVTQALMGEGHVPVLFTPFE